MTTPFHEKQKGFEYQRGLTIEKHETLDYQKDMLKENISTKNSDLQRGLSVEVGTEMPPKYRAFTDTKIVGNKYKHLDEFEMARIREHNSFLQSMISPITSCLSIPLSRKPKCSKCQVPDDDVNANDITELICNECRCEIFDLFSMCREPFDISQFFIYCYNCSDWFYGYCFGIIRNDAEFFDGYICPGCQNNTMAEDNLTPGEFQKLRMLIQECQEHNTAWPFIEPVDPKVAPDYYMVIDRPIGLRMISDKVDKHGYQKLSEFLSDVQQIFDNCRMYFPKQSMFFRCADNLESFFTYKMDIFLNSDDDPLPNDM